MDIALENISKGPQALFDHLSGKDTISELELGAVLLSDYTGFTDPLQYFKVLWQLWPLSNQNLLIQSSILRKLIQTFYSYTHKTKESVLISQFTHLLVCMENISIGFRSYSLPDKSKLENSILDTYRDLKFHFRDTKEIIKIVKFGKINSDIFTEVDDEILSVEEIDKLASLFESDDFVQGALQLNLLAQKVLPKRIQFLYDFVTTALIYLIENKAKNEHFAQIAQFFMVYAKNFNKSKKKRIVWVFERFCERVQIQTNEDLEIKEQVLRNLCAVKKDGKFEKKEKSKQMADESVKNNEKLEENKVKEEKKENSKESSGFCKNPKEKGLENPQILGNNSKGKKNKNEFKGPGKKKRDKYGPATEKPHKVQGMPSFPDPYALFSEKPKVQAEPYISTDPKLLTDSKNSLQLPVETQISDLISEAFYLFSNKERIEVGEFYEKFMEIHFPNPTALFSKIDELMSKDRPSQDSAKFWSIMLKVLEKLPQLSQYEMSALRDKHRKLKGKVRDNKEKVSRIKEQKEVFKENLKKEGKFVQGFANSDREHKRAQKPKPIPSSLDLHYQEFQVYTYKLTEELNLVVEEFSLSAELLQQIDKAIKALSARLKKTSSTISIKIIGSAGIGTYIKSSPIDLLVTDKVEPIANCISSLEEVNQISEFVFQYKESVSGFVFQLHTKNDFQSEVAGLLKKYCLIDNRVTKLIIFAKLWTKKRELEWLSGFQVSLMVIGFLQNVKPPVVVSLQNIDHTARLSEDIDVWFDNDFCIPSTNLWIFGELIYHFFHFWANRIKGVLSIKNGVYLEAPSFSILHPFTEKSITPYWTDEKISLLKSLFSDTLEALNKFNLESQY